MYFVILKSDIRCTCNGYLLRKWDSTSFVLWIECNWYYSTSPSDPIVIIPCTFLRFEDAHGQPEQQSVHHNDLWRNHDKLLLIGGGFLHIDDNPIHSTDDYVQGHGGNIMRLNGEFKLQLILITDPRSSFYFSLLIQVPARVAALVVVSLPLLCVFVHHSMPSVTSIASCWSLVVCYSARMGRTRPANRHPSSTIVCACPSG